MASLTLPAKPVEDWEKVRDEWVAHVERFISEVETWCERRDWASRRDAKTIVERGLGEYVVPQLLIQDTFGRLLFDPYACDVVSADGLIDMFVVPSYDSVHIARHADGWFLIEEDAEGTRVPWTEEVFDELARRSGRPK